MKGTGVLLAAWMLVAAQANAAANGPCTGSVDPPCLNPSQSDDSYNTAGGDAAMNNQGPAALANTAFGFIALGDDVQFMTGTFNSAFGAGAMFANTTGSQNIAVGSGAIAASGFPVGALGANTTGNYNTAVGFEALHKSTTANYNTAVGANALHDNTTGEDNVSLGFDALHSNTTGTKNNAMGRGALYSNVDGVQNLASGYAAMALNTNGHDNVAEGFQALYSNTAGTLNTATGSNAMLANTTGGNNTAVGYGALIANTVASNNTAVGSSALKGVKGYGGNTAVGRQAAYKINGANNTAVGFNALVNSTSGTGNIALGSSAGTNLTGGSNDLYLGSPGPSASGSESDTTRIGSTQTKAFMAGVFGVTVTSGSTVLMNSAGQLGTVASSLRYKQDIHDMDDQSQRLQQLRPVTFHYKADPNAQQYGLIAEEVAEVYPELVVRGQKGEVESVQYHELIPILLAQVQRLQATNIELQARLDKLEDRASR